MYFYVMPAPNLLFYFDPCIVIGAPIDVNHHNQPWSKTIVKLYSIPLKESL
jgi:hypothetical protein